MKKWKCIVGGLMLSPVIIDWLIKYVCWIWNTFKIFINNFGWWSLPLGIIAIVYVLGAFYLIYKCLDEY